MPMPINLKCPNCHGKKRNTVIDVDCGPYAEMIGIIRCTICGHEWPITISQSCISKLDTTLPGEQSDKLDASVPPDIKEDLQEAERAHYAQCDKASATMCRRALQLGLMDNGIVDAPLSAMLREALNKGLIEQRTYDLATSIKGYGDIGAHRREHLESQEVNMVIYATVKMLNELFHEDIP